VCVPLVSPYLAQPSTDDLPLALAVQENRPAGAVDGDGSVVASLAAAGTVPVQLAGDPPIGAPPMGFANPSQQEPGPQVHSLPPPPNSLYIALSGLATFGAVRMVRQVRHVHLAILPEWYHEAAPEQVGHSVLLTLDARLSLMPVCWYASDASSVCLTYRPCLDYRSDSDCRSFSSRCIPSIGPRGPPVSA